MYRPRYLYQPACLCVCLSFIFLKISLCPCLLIPPVLYSDYPRTAEFINRLYWKLTYFLVPVVPEVYAHVLQGLQHLELLHLIGRN